MLDGIRSGRRCLGQGGLPGPRRRQFGRQGGSVLPLGQEQRREPRDQTICGGRGRSKWPRCSQGRRREPSLTSAKSRITIQCIFQAAISLRVKRLQIIIAVGMPVGKLSQANQDLSAVLERQFKLLLFLQEALLGNCSPHGLALFLAL